MGTVLASKIILSVQSILQDSAGRRWPVDTELLEWLNAAQRDIVTYKTNAFVKGDAVKLQAGTKQKLPSDAVQLIDIPRNMGTDGVTPGRAIRLVERDTIDASNPNWHTATPSAVVRHFMFNPLDPLNFYVYPPQPTNGQGYVDLIYGAIPPALANATGATTIGVADIYANAIVDYILFRAFSKDSELADTARAAAHQNAYLAAMTGKARSEAAANPNASTPAHTQPSPLQGSAQ